MDCLENGTADQKYSENVRQFCMALKYYSSGAYNFVRSVFGNNLPHTRTIQKWLQPIDCSPGITASALKILERKVKEYGDKKLLGALIKDEIYIKKKIIHHEETEKFSGFVTTRDDRRNSEIETLPVASKAMVYMIVGEGFKITVAYFFLSGLNAYGQAAITQEVIASVNKTGVQIMSLTQDGPKENIKMAEILGADFYNDQPYFASPTNASDKIYCIFDPPHMLKLSRGCLKHHQLYHNQKPLDWKFIERLHEMQRNRNINLGNKLTAMHLNFHAKPMNVRLAAETLSASVANGIDILRCDGYENFNGSEETTEFIRYINNIFDVLNYKKKPSKSGNGGEREKFKRPLNRDTATEFFQYFVEAKAYLKSIEIDEVHTRKNKQTGETIQRIERKPVLRSPSSTPFFGFIHNLTALEGLYTDHVLNGSLDELIPFQFSQDHIETYFASVRAGLGNKRRKNIHVVF